MGKEEVFSPEQIMGMLMTKLKVISEAELSTKVTDCVVSVSKKKELLLLWEKDYIIYDVDVANVRRI